MKYNETLIVPMIGIGFTKQTLTTTFDGKWELVFIQVLCFQISFYKEID